jgi:phosphoglycerate dehydrogenase-like enzyme
MAVDVAIAADLDEAQISRLRAISPQLAVRRLDEEGAEIADVVLGGEEPEIGQRARRWWQMSSTGVDQLAGVDSLPPLVTNGSGVEAVPIAEFVFAAILDHAQGGAKRRAAQLRREWPEAYQEFLGASLRGCTLVVAGYGSIGREVARLAAAFGMRVLACKGNPDERRQTSGFREPGTGDPEGTIPERFVAPGQLADIVPEADFLVSTLPLTESTRGLVDGAVLGRMKPQAFLVNVGRGAVIDEPALLDALRGGRLAGATLDVVTTEPVSKDSELWTVPRLTVTPHVAGGVPRSNLAELFAHNLGRFVSGEELQNQVDLGRGY